MVRTIAVIMVTFVLVLSAGGCASTANKQDLELQGLRNQVSVLGITILII